MLSERFAAAGIPVVWTAKRFGFDPFAVIALRRLLRRRGVERLVSWDVDSAALGRILKRLAGVWWAHVYRGGDLPKLTGVNAVIAADAVAAEAVRGATTVPVSIVPMPMTRRSRETNDAEKLAARGRLRAAGWDVPDTAPLLVCVTRIDDAIATKEIAWRANLVRGCGPACGCWSPVHWGGRQSCERFSAKATDSPHSAVARPLRRPDDALRRRRRGLGWAR